MYVYTLQVNYYILIEYMYILCSNSENYIL